MRPDVIIIGGGLAGLSAAVELSVRGRKVLLLEQRQHPGGRTWSFPDPDGGPSIDNGQHLLMGCYTETRDYLRTIGSDHLASLQPTLCLPFYRPSHSRTELRCPRIPAPLHVLVGLLRLSSFSFADKLKFLRVGVALLTLSPSKSRRLAGLTVEEWLRSLRQSETARAHLWDIIAVGSLNDDPAVVSALPFVRVLRTAFFGSRLNASMLIPRTGLSELLIDPAVMYIRKNGGDVRCGSTVRAFVRGAEEITGVQMESGELITAEAYVSAVPWHDFPSLLPSNAAEDPNPLRSSPIITIYLHLDRTVMNDVFAALLDTRMQWVFNRSALIGGETGTGQTLALLVSGAADLVDLGKEELVRMALEDLHAVLPGSRSALLLRSHVIKEKRATFSPRPSTEHLRPGTRTRYRNLFLAGDWTDTGFPATIEGAVLSGRRAAAEVASMRR